MKASSKEKKGPPPILPLPTVVTQHHSETFVPLTQQWQAQERVPPVLLLTGVAGVGKREMGYYLAQWFLCERAGFRKTTEAAPEEENFSFGLFGDSPASAPPALEAAPPTAGPCGECSQCRKALQGSWVDFREVGAPSSKASDGDESDDADSEAPSGTGMAKLKIDAFRDLKATMGFGAHEGGYRIFLIANAERMTPQAANSLLKLLEEPPPSWIFILTATDSSLLLPTLVSRCQRIRLRPFSNASITQLLQSAGISPEKQTLSLTLGQGSWKRSLELADDSILEKRQQILKFLENPPENLNSVLDWASTGADSLGLLLDLLEPLTLELIKAHLSEKTPTDRFLSAHLKYVSMRIRDREQMAKFWLERAERMAEARRQISLPLNKKLLTQEILLPYLLP